MFKKFRIILYLIVDLRIMVFLLLMLLYDKFKYVKGVFNCSDL